MSKHRLIPELTERQLKNFWLKVDKRGDMVYKGRAASAGTSQPGESNGRSVLTVRDVLAIRRSNKPKAELADKYNVSRPLVSMIISRKKWRHI